MLRDYRNERTLSPRRRPRQFGLLSDATKDLISRFCRVLPINRLSIVRLARECQSFGRPLTLAAGLSIPVRLTAATVTLSASPPIS
jgi:hypothetical protein